ncbi:efflux RND transporter periplasmic adaptor subunit [Flavobacterium sp. MFBS3-15]|uniref:efflux RND transporter periplasmic adaptor subunit n=1 Tax=Flavobacterium sp. MFBS3-15 TaxID=2989816 RepID=UPI0022358FE9|nr:efflux RND transporter periplasmic adaptor subunit [Flavobacterium sp. MFBS3-15]MCW4467618.1 efflux RND transporter periplasmic adaptor subunit [Flavobacterium sp. MFBS3-15]
MKKKLLLILIGAGIVSAIAYRLVSNRNKISESATAAAAYDIRIPVTIATASEEMQEIRLVKTGKLAAAREGTALSASNGTVLRLMFQLGDRVTEGQPLAVIDTRVLELELQKAESNAIKLKRDLQTYTELYQGQAATEQKVDEVRQGYSDALNQAMQLRRQIADATVRAPVGGIIASRPIEEGTFAGIGTEIATIVDLSGLKVQVNLTESEVYQVRQGQAITLTTSIYPGKAFAGTISFISPRANQANNYQVEVTAANDGQYPLRSGTFVSADFSTKTQRKVLLIPRAALNQGTQEAAVYVAKDDKAVLRAITVGLQYGSKVEVTAGLLAGEQVITSGQINLKDGTVIKHSKKQ